MKRKYQGVIVLNMQGKEDSVDTLINRIGKEIEEEGASLQQVDRLGRREFAYPSNHISGGFFVNYHFEAEPDTIVKVRNRLALNTDIHLQHYDRKN